MDKPKVAWIDHNLYYSLPFRDKLVYQGGCDIYSESTLGELEKKCDLSSFKVILCHVGREKQKETLTLINKKYPHLKIGFMTNINECLNFDVPVFGFDNPTNFYKNVLKFIKEN